MMRPFLRRATALILFPTAVAMNNNNSNCSELKEAQLADPLGFRYRFTPEISMKPNPTPVYLAGVARVCTQDDASHSELFRAGIYLSQSTVDRAKMWWNQSGKSDQSLCYHLLKRENIITPYQISNPIKIAVVLSFGSKTDANNVLSLIHRGMKGCPESSYHMFASAFKRISGEKLYPDDEVIIYWYDNGDLTIAKNNDKKSTVNEAPVNTSLLEAFVGEEYAVAKDLRNSVVRNIPYILCA